MTELRDTPAAPALFVPALEPPSPEIDMGWHEVTEYEVEQAWQDGYTFALTDVAARTVELATTWAGLGHLRRGQQVDDRIRDMTALAAAHHAQYGTREWPGLENGGTLPSPDWGATARHLRAVPKEAA